MAETFQLITGLPEDRPRVYNIAGKTQEEAMKYLRYLHRNALFGTHTGLPPQIKNSKINESLVSNIGDYSVIDVYAKQLTKCMIGTVVNFILDDTVNPLGETYVYPCTDKNKPMGYMISDATPDTMGVCLVHGVLEVPLYYFGDEGEKKNYVEYDLENKCFKFSDSGYPVFNVYQDVDGDWIAIILFGDTSSDYGYDGPFAVSVAGITGSTMFVDVAEGDFIHENDRTTFYDEDLMSDIALGSGETLWLNTYLSGATWEYSFEARTESPTQYPGGSLWYRIAENTGNDLVQLQYGDIFNDIQHLQVESVSGSTAFIRITGYSSSNRTEDNIMLRGIGCSFNTLGQNDIGIIVEGSTGGSLVQHLYSDTKVIDGTTVSSPAVCLSDSAEHVNIVGGTNTYVALGEHGEIIVGSTYSYTPTYQQLTSSVVGGTASVGITGSNSKVNFEGMGNNYITKIRSNATIEERQSWGTHYNSETGEDELKDAGWRGIIPLKIFDNLSDDFNIMTEISMLSEVDGSTVSYPLIIPDTTDEELSIIADVALGKTSTSDIPKELIDKALDFALDRISNDKSPYYNSTLEDPDDEALRNIPNADNIIVYGVIPVLNSFVSGDTVATLGIYGSTNTVTFVAGNNVLFSSGEEGEIIVDAIGGTASYTGSFYVTSYDTTDGEAVTHHYTITDTNDRAPSNLDYAGWVHIGNDSYHVDAISGTFVDGDSVYLIGTFSSDNSVSLAFSQIHSPSVFPNINANQFCVRICYASDGVMHQTQYGDIVQPAKLVGDGTTTQVIGNTITAITSSTVQSLTSSVSGTTSAVVGLTGSTETIKFVAGENTTITEGQNGEIVLGATVSGGGSFTYTGPFAVSVSSYSGSTVRMTVAKGTVVIGNKRYNVPAQTQYVSVAYGEYLCLNGYYEGEGYEPEFSYISVDDPDDYSISEDHFLIIIAQNVDGTSAKQIQFGEISTIPWGISGGTFTQDIRASVSGGTAFIGLTGSTNNVKVISDGSVDITGVTNNTIQLAVSGGTGGGSSDYSILATGGTTGIQLQENTNYIVWVKVADGDLEQATHEYLEEHYYPLTIHEGDAGDMVLELPLMGTSSAFSFIKIDNKLRAMDIIVVDTENKGIVYGDPVHIYKDGNTVYTDDYYFNSCPFDHSIYSIMYDPEGIDVKITGNTYRKAYWIIWPIED